MEAWERLMQIREGRCVSVEEIASLLNVSEGQVRAWEAGKKAMPTHHYISLARYYHLSLDYIAGLTDEEKRIEIS